MVSILKGGSPRRQVALFVLLGVLACAALVALYLGFLRTDYAVLFSDLRTADASTIVAELDRQKVPYRLADGGTRILVPQDKVDATRLSVMGQDLPLKGQVGFELFNKSDMGLTDFAQRINYQRAIQGELGRTIMTMPSVESARVHLSIGERSIFRDDRVPPKASVSIVARAGHRLPLGSVRGIQRLVASAVPELDAENVVVIDEEGRILGNELAADLDAGPASGLTSTELHYEDAVRQAIAPFAPRGTEVAVRAEPKSLAAPGAATAARNVAARPAGRDFALRVTVALGAPVDPATEQRLREAVRTATGTERALGDVVRITLAQADVAPLPAPVAVAPAAAAPADSASGGLSLWLWVAFGLALAGLAGIAFHRRRIAERPLGEKQREDFVSRFQMLLDREEASV